MAGFISKQPNGKYCRFSTIIDCPTDINMTFEDYVKVVMRVQHLDEEYARIEAQKVFSCYLRSFDEVLRRFIPNNLSERSLRFSKTKMKVSGQFQKIKKCRIL